jgi:hypothetical protein
MRPRGNNDSVKEQPQRERPEADQCVDLLSAEPTLAQVVGGKWQAARRYPLAEARH